MLKYFLTRTRAYFHIVLCFSPVGATFRVRARRFPGLINCSSINKFHAWPRDALMSVATRFIDDLDLTNDTVKESVAQCMAEVHVSVTAMSVDFREKMRRYNYVTPKSFLELIAFYRYLLGVKRDAVGLNIKRLDDGLAKLKQTATDVAELKIDVQKAMLRAEEEVKSTDILVAQMSKQTAEANVEKDKADIVAAEAKVAADAAAVIKAQSEKELAAAAPAMEAAKRAVAGLSKNSLNELKGFKQPPKGVERVTGACAMMLAAEFKNQYENISWVLYPNDSTPAGRELRLRQEYFFTSASIQDILARHLAEHGNLANLSDQVAIHLNDTHPAIGVAELMRLLVDEHGFGWVTAWAVTKKVFSYTNHTLMPEALETWPVSLMQHVLPRLISNLHLLPRPYRVKHVDGVLLQHLLLGDLLLSSAHALRVRLPRALQSLHIRLIPRRR
jgi:hypothetical protein